MSAVLALVIGLVAAANGERAHLAQVELVGPLSSARFEPVATDGTVGAGQLGSTRVEGGLRVGERRRLVLPLPTRRPLEVSVEGEGSARFEAWLAEPDEEPLAGLSAGLRARPLPPVEDPSRGGLAQPTWALLAAGAALVLSLRRRPAWALALAVALAGTGYALERRLAPAPDPGLLLYDGDLSVGAWRRAEARAAQLSLTPPRAGSAFSVVARPAQAPLSWVVSLDGDWCAYAPGARVYALSSAAPGAEKGAQGGLARGANGLFDLAEVWWREAGEWSARGPWLSGAPLSAAEGAAQHAESPPGWLASGLPQGVPVLLARAAQDEGGRPVWLRVTGL